MLHEVLVENGLLQIKNKWKFVHPTIAGNIDTGRLEVSRSTRGRQIMTALSKCPLIIFNCIVIKILKYFNIMNPSYGSGGGSTYKMIELFFSDFRSS